MNNYKLMIAVPQIVTVSANTEEEAIQKLKDAMIAEKTLKPADYIEIKVIQEIN